MKFAAGLIKIFSGVLSAFVFGAFLYYTYQYQTTKDADNLFTANIALVVFLISSVTFALLFIVFDIYQNKNNESDLVKLLKGTDLNRNTENSNITDLLVKIASFNNQTNQLLDGHFKELTTGINNLNNKSDLNGTNFQNTLQQLTAICGEISQYVDNIKTENAKENQRNAGHSGSFDVLVATVSRLSSDLNDLNGRMLDVVNQISKNVTTSIQSHTDIDNEIKELLQKILLAKNNVNTSEIISESTVSTPALTPDTTKNIEDESGEAPQSVADFYEEHLKNSTAEKIDEVPEEPDEVEEDDEIQQENEQRIDELLKAPLTDESFEPTTNDLTESQFENLVEDQVADDIAAKETKEPWKEPLSTEISDAEQTYTQQPTAIEPYFETPNEQSETFDTTANFQDTTTPETITSQELPSSFSLEAADPFNPSPEHFEDLAGKQSLTDEKPISLDLEDEEPVSLDLPNEESNVKLDDIFNDNFASEIADLDILKDNGNNQNEGKISVEDLLADDNDPYNPNK